VGRSGLGKRGGSRFQGLGDVDRVPQELLAGLGQLGAGPAPLDQSAPGQRLKFGQRFGDSGLAQVKPFGGARKRPFLSDDHEAAEVPEPNAG